MDVFLPPGTLFARDYRVVRRLGEGGHNLKKELLTMMESRDEEALFRHLPGLREVIADAAQDAAKRGQETAVAALLGRLFTRRVGRGPTSEEQRSILARAEALGPVEVEDVLLDLERDALLRWLAEPVPRP
jgi:hypothetical protein